MKKLLLICLAAIAVLSSCNDYETYGDKKEKERNAISKFISDSSIVVISEDQFVTQGYVTNVGPKIEYFYFDNDTNPVPLDRAGYFDLTAYAKYNDGSLTD